MVFFRASAGSIHENFNGIMAFPDPENSKKRKLQKNDQVGQNLKNLFYLDQLHKKIVEK